MEIGDVVVIIEDNLARSEWRMGRVSDVHPGPDGLVRSATVDIFLPGQGGRGSVTQLQRPVQKLCRILESEEQPGDPPFFGLAACLRLKS